VKSFVPQRLEGFLDPTFGPLWFLPMLKAAELSDASKRRGRPIPCYPPLFMQIRIISRPGVFFICRNFLPIGRGR
jgi:hypothetical protein